MEQIWSMRVHFSGASVLTSIGFYQSWKNVAVKGSLAEEVSGKK